MVKGPGPAAAPRGASWPCWAATARAKTTTPPPAGRHCSKPQRGTGAPARGRMGVLPQNPQTLFVKKTVREDLFEMLRRKAPTGEEERVARVAALCRLEDAAGPPPLRPVRRGAAAGGPGQGAAAGAGYPAAGRAHQGPGRRSLRRALPRSCDRLLAGGCAMLMVEPRRGVLRPLRPPLRPVFRWAAS